MISRPFIDRPILATVISLVIVLTGLISMNLLPIEQYPDITPPTVVVSTSFPGADAATVAESVAAPIEQEVNGAPNMIYMSSESSSNGNYNLKVTFEVGTDIDIAAIDIQDRVKQAESRLPGEVVQEGIGVSKQANALVQIFALVSVDGRYDETYVYNYADINVREALRRIPGVGSVSAYGTRPYSMRVWLDPLKLAALGLSVGEVRSAIREQNTASSGGTIGEQLEGEDVEVIFPVTAVGRLTAEEEFADIVVRAEPDGAMVRLRDIARVELASYTYSVNSRLDGANAAVMAVYLLPGANMLNVADQVQTTLAGLAESFPDGIESVVVHDSSEFVRESIAEVRSSLFQATGLVIAVVFLFLKRFRSTLIPAIAVPISLVGTFSAMFLLGFSINTFTLLALVLAIGIVVDDAIVVVENVERLMADEGLTPYEATVKAMSQLGGALVATTLVLVAVFVPVSLMSGITGQLYRQFGLTISASVVISTVVALTLSPALAAIILRPPDGRERPWMRSVDRVLDAAARMYERWLTATLNNRRTASALFLLLTAAALWLYGRAPQGFLPTEDQGYFNVEVALPEGAAMARTEKVLRRLESFSAESPAVKHVFTRVGSSPRYGTDESKGNLFIALNHWDERSGSGLGVAELVEEAKRLAHGVPEAQVSLLQPAEIPGFGENSGFEMQLMDPTGVNVRGLLESAETMVSRGLADPRISDVGLILRPEVPQYLLDLDRNRAKAMGLPIGDVFSTVKAFFSRGYVGDFNKFGRVYRVSMQADGQYRRYPEDAALFHIRSSTGEMVPVTSVATLRATTGPGSLKRYNMASAVPLNGVPGRGRSSGEAMAAMEDIARESLSSQFRYEWSGLSYQEKRAAGQTGIVLTMALVFVFLVLAGLYESWTLPVTILLLVPVAALGAISAILIRGTANDVYFQIGLVALIGLSAKNAILIVEVAKSLVDGGRPVVEAALEAARLRFRPILMTALSFVFGLIPLVIASGAGARGRQSIGTGVFGGMTLATLLGLLLIPLFFVVIMSRSRKRPHDAETNSEEASP